MAAAWGDYDNDGFLDLFVARGLGRNRLYHNNGNGTFTRIDEGPGADTGMLSVTNLNLTGGIQWTDVEPPGLATRFYRAVKQ